MKPISLHPTSVLAGATVAVLALLATSAQSPNVQSFFRPPPRAVEHHIVGVPDPRASVLLRGSVDYIVPSGKLLVITGMGSNSVSTAHMRIDNVLELYGPYNGPTTIGAIPAPGIVVQPGSVVSFDRAEARAIGYLIDQ